MNFQISLEKARDLQFIGTVKIITHSVLCAECVAQKSNQKTREKMGHFQFMVDHIADNASCRE